MEDDSGGLAFLGASPPELKPTGTPITGPGPVNTVDTIPPSKVNQPGDQAPNQQPPKPYQDENEKNKGDDGFKKPKSGLSGREGATDVPSWAKGQRPRKSEPGKKFTERLLDSKYGRGKYPKGPGSEYNKIRKWGDRAFE